MKRSKVRVSLVEFGHVDLDVAEVGPLCGVLGPAALHEDGQLLRVAFVVCGRPKVRLLTVPHLLYDLCGGERTEACSSEGNAVCFFCPMCKTNVYTSRILCGCRTFTGKISSLPAACACIYSTLLLISPLLSINHIHLKVCKRQLLQNDSWTSPPPLLLLPSWKIHEGN